jgi:hypothetical protein
MKFREPMFGTGRNLFFTRRPLKISNILTPDFDVYSWQPTSGESPGVS